MIVWMQLDNGKLQVHCLVALSPPRGLLGFFGGWRRGRECWPNRPNNSCWSKLPARRTFYGDTMRAGVVVNQVETLLVYATELLGYLFYQLMRCFVVAAILMPFSGLVRHARREPSVHEVCHCSHCVVRVPDRV